MWYNFSRFFPDPPQFGKWRISADPWYRPRKSSSRPLFVTWSWINFKRTKTYQNSQWILSCKLEWKWVDLYIKNNEGFLVMGDRTSSMVEHLTTIMEVMGLIPTLNSANHVSSSFTHCQATIIYCIHIWVHSMIFYLSYTVLCWMKIIFKKKQSSGISYAEEASSSAWRISPGVLIASWLEHLSVFHARVTVPKVNIISARILAIWLTAKRLLPKPNYYK